jgi:hypothetical protein
MKGVTKTKLNRVLNFVLLISGAFLLGSGWALDERLPRGRSGHGMSLLGLDRHEWGDLHAWSGYAMAVLLVVHLLLHTSWLWRVAAKTKPWKLATGLGTAAALVALFLLIPVAG